jgi:hypothetical protein
LSKHGLPRPALSVSAFISTAFTPSTSEPVMRKRTTRGERPADRLSCRRVIQETACSRDRPVRPAGHIATGRPRGGCVRPSRPSPTAL